MFKTKEENNTRKKIKKKNKTHKTQCSKDKNVEVYKRGHAMCGLYFFQHVMNRNMIM